MTDLLTNIGKSFTRIGFIFALGAFLFGFSHNARATDVIDQQQTSAGSHIATSSLISQWFLPSKSNISKFTFSVHKQTGGDYFEYLASILKGDSKEIIATTTVSGTCGYTTSFTATFNKALQAQQYYIFSLTPQAGMATSTCQGVRYVSTYDAYTNGDLYLNGTKTTGDIYFIEYYDSAYNGNLTIYSPINGITYQDPYIYFTGEADLGLKTLSIWLDNLTTGDTSLILSDLLIDQSQNYSWSRVALLNASSTYRARYIASTQSGMATSSSTFYTSSTMATSTVMDLGFTCPTVAETCADDDTSAILGQMSCAFKRAGVWLTCPDSAKMLEMMNATNDLKTKFPIADYLAITGAVKTGLASTSVASSTTIGVPNIRKTATGTQFYIQPILSSSTLPATVGSSNASLIRTGFIYIIWIFAGAFVAFQVKNGITS